MFVTTAAIAALISCNVHEIGHAGVGTALGWDVERVNWCLPTGGSVDYAHVGTWAANAQGYAGGLSGAAILALAYVIGFEHRPRALRSPRWWAGGLGVVVWVGPQILVAMLEGSAGPGEDYTEAFSESPALLAPLVGVAVAAGPAAYLWRWRVIWRTSRTAS